MSEDWRGLVDAALAGNYEGLKRRLAKGKLVGFEEGGYEEGYEEEGYEEEGYEEGAIGPLGYCLLSIVDQELHGWEKRVFVIKMLMEAGASLDEDIGDGTARSHLTCLRGMYEPEIVQQIDKILSFEKELKQRGMRVVCFI